MAYVCLTCAIEPVPMEGMKCLECAEQAVRAWVVERDAKRREDELKRLRAQTVKWYRERMKKKR